MKSCKTKNELRGWWVLLVIVALFVAGSLAGVYFGNQAFVPSQGPGVSPPFYSIRRDYIDGICRGVTLLIIMMVSKLAWKRYPDYAGMGLWMGVLWMGGGILKSIVIAFNTTNILSPLAESSWATFTDYFRDPMIQASRWVGIILGLAIFYMIRRRKISQQAGAGYPPQGVGSPDP